MRSRISILGFLAGGALALVLWAALRSPSTVEPPPPAVGPGVDSAPVAAPPTATPLLASRSPGASRSPDPRAVDEMDLTPAQLPEIRRAREALHQTLAAEGDPLLAEVTAAFATRGLTNPAVIAAGWALAVQWGLHVRSEANAATNPVEDAVLRDELAAARRKILIDVPLKELEALLGAPVDPQFQADLEQIGRRHAATARRSPPLPEIRSSDEIRRRRKVAAAGEEPEP